MDHHLPRYHVRPPRGYLNDPNGPIVIGDRTHLYFQYRYTTDLDEPVVWGHASTTDLAHWSHHRPALSPLPGGPDADGCWSGNTVATSDAILAFYSGARDERKLQTSLVARSVDRGASFADPVPTVPEPDGLVEFRDPFVWRDGGIWRMVLGAGTADEIASVRVWSSRDLDSWTADGALAVLPRTVVSDDAGGTVDTGGMWECPQVLEVDGVRVVLVGAWGGDAGIMRVLALLPDGQGDRLGGLGAYPIDDGSDFYAPSVLRDGPRGPIVFGWITEGRDRECWTEAGWAGAISLPRELRLGAGGRMLSSPAAEVLALRRGIADPAAVGPQFEVVASVSSSGADGLRLSFGEEWLDIVVDAAGAAAMDRTAASADRRAHADAVRIPGAIDGGRGSLRVFVDGSVLEVFTSTGRAATTRFYPTTPPPWSILPLGDASLDVWALG